jgi:formate dehydrogenase assembly factor FdhD
MDSKELRLFRESYASIRKPQTENIQEGEMEQQGQVERYRRESIKREQEREMRREREQRGMKAGPNKPETQTNSADLFDIVKGHLMSEGFADTEEAALAIMANMSEEWRQSIVESSCGGGHSKPKKKKKSGY